MPPNKKYFELTPDLVSKMYVYIITKYDGHNDLKVTDRLGRGYVVKSDFCVIFVTGLAAFIP